METTEVQERVIISTRISPDILRRVHHAAIDLKLTKEKAIEYLLARGLEVLTKQVEESSDGSGI